MATGFTLSLRAILTTSINKIALKNILYIGSATSIHDIKWMSFFSQQPEKFKIFLVCEEQNLQNFHTSKKRARKIQH
jgi:hypothetical protein